MRTLTGLLENVEYFDTSRNGNNHYTAHIDGVEVFTGVDSSLGAAIKNYQGKRVKLEARIIRGKLTIDSRPEYLPDYPDTNTHNYRKGEFAAVRDGADKKYAPSLVLRSDAGCTKHMGITWEEFERITKYLTEGI